MHPQRASIVKPIVMAKKYLFLLILTFFFSAAVSRTSAKSANGVEFELIVRQRPAEIEKYFEITRDTVQILLGKKLSLFMVNFGLEIEAALADTQAVNFSAQLVTIGSQPFNMAEKYRVEYNLPARMENIPGKNGSRYQLLISPRKRVKIDTISCPINIDKEGEFTTDPSANFDFYFVKNSLADYHWNNIKNYIESEHKRFREALEISSPGKVNFYLCPCPVNTVRWDKRFGYMIDPGRLSIFAVYNHDYSSIDPILPNMLKLLRLWGYAPPFLVEGLGGYFDFVTYEMKKAKVTSKLPKIRSLLTTSEYYSCDPRTAELTAASFVKFLADGFGINKVKAVYEMSDDLTLSGNLERVFASSLDSLESDWSNYVDTATLSRPLFDYYASRAGALFDFKKQIEYYEEMKKYDQSRNDSVDTWKKLGQIYYQYGEYYKAQEAYQRLIKIDSSLPVYHQIMANLYIINGKYDDGWRESDTVYAHDSNYVSSQLLKARILVIKGDTAQALRLAGDFYQAEKSTAGKIEFLLFLGKIYGQKGKYHNGATARQNFSDALAWSTEMISKSPDDPIHKLRAGLAYLGLKEYGKASEYLKMAEFTELRPLFLGEILIALGNLDDLRSDHKEGIMYYQRALSYPLSVYQRDLCVKYIDKPYKN